jgi:hypothetical protein
MAALHLNGIEHGGVPRSRKQIHIPILPNGLTASIDILLDVGPNHVPTHTICGVWCPEATAMTAS